MSLKSKNSQIKELLYPELNKQKKSKNLMIRNIKNIKKLQNLNRFKNNQKSLLEEGKLYIFNFNKLLAKTYKNQYMNISSKLFEQNTTNNFHITTLKENINEEMKNCEYIRTKRLNRPISSINLKMPIKTYRNGYNGNKIKKAFEQEYKQISFGNLTNIDLDSLFEKQLQKLREINKSEEEEYNAKINNNLNKKDTLEEKKYDDINQFNSFNKKLSNKNNNFNRIKSSKTIKPRPLSNFRKATTKLFPSIETLSPINKNILQERILSNKNMREKKLVFNKINPIERPITTNKTIMHRNYGHVPKYLKGMKIKSKIMKEIEKKKEEEKNYPKGTRLLSEEERNLTLQKLKENKKELENLVTKLPIACDSIGAKNRQNKLFKELDEIVKAIITFSKNKVFVKIDK